MSSGVSIERRIMVAWQRLTKSRSLATDRPRSAQRLNGPRGKQNAVTSCPWKTMVAIVLMQRGRFALGSTSAIQNSGSPREMNAVIAISLILTLEIRLPRFPQ
jgi:hypothetical protein